MSLSQIAKETVCDSTNQLLHNYHSQNHIHQSVKTKINNETTTKVQSKPLSSPSSRSLLGNLNFGLASNRKQSNHHHILKKSVNVNNSILSPSDIKHISSYARTIDTSKKEWIIKHRRLASNLLDIFKEGITRGDKDTLLASEIRKFLRANENPEDDVVSFIQERSKNALNTCFLAYCYEFGIGLSRDLQKAFNLYKKSAESDNPIGQFCLGLCFYEEKGMRQHVSKSLFRKDESECFYWMRKSAEAGFSRGQCSLGYCYVRGIGTEQEDKKSLYWFGKSAEGGCALGQANLGLSYEKGIGTEKDMDKAFYWYKKSAQGGNSKGQCCLGLCYDEGIGVLTDKEKAFYWYQRAAEGGNADGKYYCGNCYLNGNGTKKDEIKALHYYQKSAEDQDADGECMLGYCYQFGWGTQKDLHKAIKWYLSAAKNGNVAASEVLITLFY